MIAEADSGQPEMGRYVMVDMLQLLYQHNPYEVVEMSHGLTAIMAGTVPHGAYEGQYPNWELTVLNYSENDTPQFMVHIKWFTEDTGEPRHDWRVYNAADPSLGHTDAEEDRMLAGKLLNGIFTAEAAKEASEQRAGYGDGTTSEVSYILDNNPGLRQESERLREQITGLKPDEAWPHERNIVTRGLYKAGKFFRRKKK